jgi:adenylate kinase family enzyme
MKIVIIGLPGAGKSTFAGKLGKKLGIPVHHLDAHMFLPGGIKRDREEFVKIQQKILHESSWIIEGCALSTLEMRFSEANECIDFNLPRLLCIYRTIKRLFVRDRTLADTAEGCTKVVTWEMVKYIWTFNKKKRAGIDQLREKYPHVKFTTFQSSSDAKSYLGRE